MSGMGGRGVTSIRHRFLKLKSWLSDMQSNKLTLTQLIEAMEYVSGKHDPTQQSSDEDIQRGIDRMNVLWEAGRSEGGKRC